MIKMDQIGTREAAQEIFDSGRQDGWIVSVVLANPDADPEVKRYLSALVHRSGLPQDGNRFPS